MKTMRLAGIGFASLLFVMCLAPNRADALGLGASVTAAAGGLEFDGGNADYDTLGFGFVLDTAVAADRTFNYRLQLGYANASYEYPDGDRYEMCHTFGFGLLRTDVVRLWLGPQIGFYYESLHVDPICGSCPDFDVDSYGVNIGPAFGINIHLGSTVSLAATVFARVGGCYSDDQDDATEWQAGGSLAVLFRLGPDK